MTPELIGSETPATDEDITAMETELGVVVPDDYREFMLKFNGGEFEDEVDYRMLEEAPRGTGGFRYFFSIAELNEVENSSIDGLVAIAEDETGEICLACGDEQRGKVYYVDFDRGLNQWTFLVANSFTDFFLGITAEEDEPG